MANEKNVHLRVLEFSDLHLDAPFDGMSDDKGAQAREGLRLAFDGIMNKVRECGVQLVLIPGDLFDNRFVTNNTVELLYREFNACPGTTFIIAPGRADLYEKNPIYESGRLPSNCRVFSSPEIAALDIDEYNLTVYGWAFSESLVHECPLRGHHVADPSRINIVCGYGDLNGEVDAENCQFSSADLRAFGADFYAFGSRHESENYESVDTAICAYSGAPVSTGFDEPGTGAANFVLLDLEDGNISIKLKRFPLEGLRLYNEEIDITGVDTKSEIISRITNRINERHYGVRSALNLSFVGEVDPRFVVPGNFESETFGLFSFRVKDRTLPLYGARHYARDMSAAGEIYRKLIGAMEGDNEEERLVAARAFREALAALEG